MSSEQLKKPLFSLNSNDVNVSEEEDESIEEIQENRMVTTQTEQFKSGNTAKIIEGEEEEDEEEIHTTPIESNANNDNELKVNPPLQKRTHSQSSLVRKLMASNISTRKYASKKILYIYGRIKEEIHKISSSLDLSIKTLQNTWDHYSSTNSKLDTLNQKLSQLRNPIVTKST